MDQIVSIVILMSIAIYPVPELCKESRTMILVNSTVSLILLLPFRSVLRQASGTGPSRSACHELHEVILVDELLFGTLGLKLGPINSHMTRSGFYFGRLGLPNSPINVWGACRDGGGGGCCN